jgi:hypothetical protein
LTGTGDDSENPVWHRQLRAGRGGHPPRVQPAPGAAAKWRLLVFFSGAPKKTLAFRTAIPIFCFVVFLFWNGRKCCRSSGTTGILAVSIFIFLPGGNWTYLFERLK